MIHHFYEICTEKQGLASSGGDQGSFIDQNSNLKVAESSEVDSLCNQESFHDRIKNSSVWCQKFDSRRQRSEKSVHQGLNHDPSTLVSPPKVVGDGKIDLENQWLMKLSNQENSDTKISQLPLALPSPKAPSESWLKRTLPTVSSRNTSMSRPYPASQIHARGQSPKWETIVKSSNGHLRFAEVVNFIYFYVPILCITSLVRTSCLKSFTYLFIYFFQDLLAPIPEA